MYRLSLEFYADCIIAHRQRRAGMHERSMIIRESSLVPYLRNTAVTRQLELDFDKSRKGSISKLEPDHLESILKDLAEVQRVNPNCWQKAECYLDFVPPAKLPFLLTNVLFCRGIILDEDLAKYDVKLPDLLEFPAVRNCNSLYFSRRLPTFADELFEWCHAGQSERLLTCVVGVDEAKAAYERLKKSFEDAKTPVAYKVKILSPYPRGPLVRKWKANEKLVNVHTNERIHLRRSVHSGFEMKVVRTAK
ncbi:hypothetical protein AAVH_35497 [Aphelenchoides avenae]|nr:hypothetical protein AAVH_35497 [Aphelenchus avenae]